MDYLEAYQQRIECNDETIKEIAEQLKIRGCKVFANSSGYISFIKIIKDNKHVIFGFTDVPYRWQLYCNINPTKEYGSSNMIRERHGTENTFNVDDIINSMQPNPTNLQTNHLKEL